MSERLVSTVVRSSGINGTISLRSSNTFCHLAALLADASCRFIARRAVSAVLERLESYPDAAVPVLHWYSGSFKELERAVALGCWFSVGPAMASSKNGQALISRMPPERIVTETDGPFAALGDRRLVPWDVNIAVPKLAELWSVSRESTEARLRTNLRDLLREAPSV